MSFLSADKMIVDLPYRSRLFGSHSPKKKQSASNTIPRIPTKSQERVGLLSPEKPTESNLVEIQLKADVVWVILDESAPMDKVIRSLRNRLAFCQEEIWRKCVRLDLGNRMPDRIAVRNISRILLEERKLTLVGLRCTQDALRRFASREHRLCFDVEEAQVVQDEPLETQVTEAVPEKKKNITPTLLQRTIRSGAVLRIDNDLILYGDINPGAVVECSGSITVFGSIRGSVHAGSKGNVDAIVMAVSLEPSHLRIADKKANPEQFTSIPKRWSPVVAHLAQGQMVIEDYRRSSLRIKIGGTDE